MQVIVPLLFFSFLLYCILDVVLTAEDRVKNLPKLVWLLLVVLLPVIGGVAWLLAGRPEGTGRAPGGQIGRSGPAHPRHPANQQPRSSGRSPASPRSRSSRAPRGPDDDPEFIRQLEQRLRRRDDDPPAA